jgi:hypothetical protein
LIVKNLMRKYSLGVYSVERACQIYEVLYRNALSTGVAVVKSVDVFHPSARRWRAL